MGTELLHRYKCQRLGNPKREDSMKRRTLGMIPFACLVSACASNGGPGDTPAGAIATPTTDGTGEPVDVIMPPCHPNPTADADVATVRNRGDIAQLPKPLKDRLLRLAARPHTYLPLQAFAEADGPSQLFQYYLIDTN